VRRSHVIAEGGDASRPIPCEIPWNELWLLASVTTNYKHFPENAYCVYSYYYSFPQFVLCCSASYSGVSVYDVLNLNNKCIQCVVFLVQCLNISVVNSVTSKEQSKVGYGRVIHSQTKEVVWNVYKFMKQAADNGEVTDLNQVRNMVFKATGISRSSRHKVLEEEKNTGHRFTF